MALVLPKSIFFHVGRTAGHFVRSAVRQMSIPTYEVGAFHDWPSSIALSEAEKKRLHFCFVRHPIAWLRSYWCLQMQSGWSSDSYSVVAQSDCFAEFLEKLIEAFPDGPVSQVFAPFVMQCDQVGRQEDLKRDLLRILTKAGEAVVPSVLEQMGHSAVEVDPRIRDAARAPADVLERVMQAEATFCERWGYRDIPRDAIGPRLHCSAPYVQLGQSSVPLAVDAQLDWVANAFVLDGRSVSSVGVTRAPTMAIMDVLTQLDFAGKDVIDIACADGVLCFYAESMGAASVVGVARQIPNVANCLTASLASRVTFVKEGHYGVEQVVDRSFDIAICSRILHQARHPHLLIRTLSRLMKRGGRLVLQCEYLEAFEGVPMMLTPLGAESPNDGRECSYFNREGLLNALAAYGFHDFVVHSHQSREVRHGRLFAQLPIAAKDDLHDSESSIRSIVLSCTWHPERADQDPRYAIDGVMGQTLADRWESELPRDGVPQAVATQETIEQLRGQVLGLEGALRQRELELEGLQSAYQDRHNALLKCHSQLAVYRAQRVRNTVVRPALQRMVNGLRLARRMCGWCLGASRS